MARNEMVEKRLREWAQWMKVGDGSGYPTKSTLHPNWSPPASGQVPSMKTNAPSSARSTHRAIQALSERLQDTLVLHYVTNLPVADQAVRLGCTRQTVDQRICTAHRMLHRAFTAN